MNVGAIIKKFRKERNMALVDLAEKSHLALATLSRIENGKMTGTLDSHLRIAQALDLTLPELYKELPSSKKIVDVKAKEIKTDISIQDHKSVSELLTSNTSRKKMLPILIKIGKGGRTQTEATRPDIERFIFVLDGKVEAYIDENKYDLNKGDSIYFESSVPHYFKNIAAIESRIIQITCPPVM